MTTAIQQVYAGGGPKTRVYGLHPGRFEGNAAVEPTLWFCVGCEKSPDCHEKARRPLAAGLLRTVRG